MIQYISVSDSGGFLNFETDFLSLMIPLMKCVRLDTSFFLFLSDINECTGERDGCEHFCRNTIGSYYCMCRDGYYLHQDVKDCLGRQCFCFH